MTLLALLGREPGTTMLPRTTTLANAQARFEQDDENGEEPLWVTEEGTEMVPFSLENEEDFALDFA